MERSEDISQGESVSGKKDKLREFGFRLREELYLSEGSYTQPISLFFIRLTIVFWLLVSFYDIIFLRWLSIDKVVSHYLPVVFLYLVFEILRYLGYRKTETSFHFIISLSAILPLLHLTIISPESIQQIYLFEAVLLTGLYYIVPGKDMINALFLSVLISIFFISLLLLNKVEFTERWILKLLFFHLLIVGGLMLTSVVQGMLNHLVRISSELSSQNSIFRKLKEEFSRTIDGLTLGLVLSDTRGKIIVYNDRFEELSGESTLEEIESIYDLRLSQRSIENKYFEEIFRGNEEIDEELYVERQGRFIWLHIKGMPIEFKEAGHQYLLMLEDITENKQNQLARNRQERYLQAVFNEDSSIVLYEKKKGELYITDNVKELLGWNSDSFIKGEIIYEDLILEIDRTFLQEKYKNWSDNGAEGILYLWYRIQRRDGAVIWIEERLSEIHNEDGEVITTGILIDNTELKTIERELRASETGLSRAQEMAHLGNWSYKPADQEIQASREFYRILELNEGESSSLLDFRNYIMEKDLPVMEWKLKECLEHNSKDLSIELSIKTAKDNERIVSLEIEFYWIEGELLSVEGTVIDITRRKTLELQLFQHQKMEAIGTLAGGIAHDFNNILNIIMGYSSVIKDKLPNDGDLWQKFDRINAASERAKKLVTHILTISRQQESRMCPVRLKDLIEEHFELLRAAIPAKIEMVQELTTDKFIFGDPDQIEQVIMNLSTNASYAMEPAGGVLKIELRETDDDYLKIEISDTGTGIPAQVIEKMYDPYYTTKPKGEGTGLGLAIVKGIVDSLDGRIEVESEEGKGTRFSLYFPEYKPGKQLRNCEETSKEHKNEVDSLIKVMFIDDEEDLAELFKDYLENFGMEVFTFSDGKGAIEAMISHPRGWDIIVSDISLPGMDGLEIVRRVRKVNYEIPVIMYSGFKKPRFLEEAKTLGVKKMLVKPVVPADMLKEIRAILQEK